MRSCIVAIVWYQCPENGDANVSWFKIQSSINGEEPTRLPLSDPGKQSWVFSHCNLNIKLLFHVPPLSLPSAFLQAEASNCAETDACNVLQSWLYLPLCLCLAGFLHQVSNEREVWGLWSVIIFIWTTVGGMRRGAGTHLSHLCVTVHCLAAAVMSTRLLLSVANGTSKNKCYLSLIHARP